MPRGNIDLERRRSRAACGWKAKRLITFHWDFFGPKSQMQALHFRSHLDETLRNWGVEPTTGIGSEGDGHTSVFSKSPEDVADRLRESLRPNREL